MCGSKAMGGRENPDRNKGRTRLCQADIDSRGGRNSICNYKVMVGKRWLFLVMPNIAIAYRESMTYITPVDATPENIDRISGIFNSMGESIIIEESQYPSATALSCSIAYAMRYVRANVEGAVELGFKAKMAKKIVLQTIKGAVQLLQETDEHPEEAIDKVTTPGGLTIRGLNEMENAGFTSAVIRGLKAGRVK